MNNSWDIECPKCGARPGHTCRTATGLVTTGTHRARINAFHGPQTPPTQHQDRAGEVT